MKNEKEKISLLDIFRVLTEKNMKVVIRHMLDNVKESDDPTVKRACSDLGLANIELALCCSIQEVVRNRINELDKEVDRYKRKQKFKETKIKIENPKKEN